MKKGEIKKVKNTVPLTYVIKDHDDNEIVWTFYEKDLQNISQTER